MSNANLLQKLSETNNAGLEKMVLYGRIRCCIGTPKGFEWAKHSDNGFYALLDAFAVKCLGNDYFQGSGSRNVEHVYNVKGSVLVYIDRNNFVGKYVKVSGKTLGYGVKIKQQKYRKNPSDGIAALVWDREPNGDFIIVPNFVAELGSDDPVFKHNKFLEYVLGYLDSNEMIEEYPSSGNMPFTGAIDYEELNPDSVRSIQYVERKERIDISSIKMNLIKHLGGIQAPSALDDILEDMKVQADSRNQYAKSVYNNLKSSYDFNDVSSVADSIVTSFVNTIAYRMAERVSDLSRQKCRFYVDKYLDCLSCKPLVPSQEDKNKPYLTASQIDDLTERMVSDPSILLKEDYATVIDKAIFVIGVTTGIGFNNLKSNYSSMCRVFSSFELGMWFYLLLSNPYICALAGSSLSMTEADTIFYSYVKHFSRSIFNINASEIKLDRDRLACVKAVDMSSSENSIVPRRVFRDFDTQKLCGRLLDNMFFTGTEIREVLSVICGESVSLNKNILSVLLSDSWKSNKVLQSVIDDGIINTYGDNDDLILETTLEKEIFIFQTFQELGLKETGITYEECESVIQVYEDKVKFKLEPQQRDGVHLLQYCAGVLTGCAGSGKTTTSDALVIGVEKYLSDSDLVYCAPTGKAARRMAEVLNKSVKTIHSQFHVGIGVGDSYLLSIHKKPEKAGSTRKIYFIDEAGMLNRDLLYEVARNINQGDLVYFFGDIKQLPPIGCGCPFAVLMRILPCVELGCSKRSAEGSLVNYNTTLINNLSDGVIESIISDNDFLIKDCHNVEIGPTVLNTWKQFESRDFKEDGIQVITAYSNKKYCYSSSALNPILQKYLRRNDRLCFRHGETDFYVNDRVIHTNANLYGMQRFVKTGNDTYEEVLSLGIVNGDMGTLVGCYDSTTLNFVPLPDTDSIKAGEGHYANVSKGELESLLELHEKYEDRIIKVKDYVDIDTWFAVVKVYDVSLRMPVYVLYESRKRRVEGITELYGSSLSNLELAYALTCHKMQGSQTPVAIIPFGEDSNPEFVNRNMINTMITRSQGCVALIGDVSGEMSTFNRGRTYTSATKTNSILDLLADLAVSENGYVGE